MLIFILQVALYLIACYAIAVFGEYRKFGFWGYFFASILFTPIIGLLLVVASDKRKILLVEDHKTEKKSDSN